MAAVWGGLAQLARKWPKKLDKRALRKKQEEERLLQEEIARQERERIRLLEEEERLRKEEEARIKAEEDQTRNEQESEVASYVRRVSILSVHKRITDWEQKRWNDYIYKTKEIDSLKLPIVNAFITDWMDDSSYDIESTVQTSHRCLQMVDEIASAIFACPEVYAKTRLWNEGITNLKKTIGKKLDYASFMLLKNAYLYLDEKSLNMEYDFSEGQISLCLWANIHGLVRRLGMERNGFRFWIPPDLASEDCAVRILHLRFPPSLPALSLTEEDEEMEEETMTEELLQSNELISENRDIVLEDIPDDESLNEENDVSHEEEIKTAVDNTESEAAQKVSSGVFKQKSEARVSPEVSGILNGKEQEIENGTKDYEDEKLSTDTITAKTSDTEEKYLDLNEYFLVGGLLHFDLLKVPTLTVREKGLTYIHREEPKLKRMKYEFKQFDRDHLLPEDLSSEKPAEVEETVEARQEEEPADSESEEEDNKTAAESIKQSIGLSMPIPKKVVFMNVPKPALFISDKNAFSTEGVTVVDYNKEEGRITFETTKFGIFGMFQKLYCNFPYKSWQLNGGKVIELSLVGKCLSLRIAICDMGCRLESLKPDKIVASELLGSDIWMTPEQLIQKLLSVGINIAYKKKTAKFIGISQKEKYSLVLIQKERTVKLKEEEMDNFSNEPSYSQEFSGTLYHLIKGGTTETLEVIVDRSGLIQNVRLLLQKCRILSCA